MGFNPLSRGLVGLVLLASSLYAAPGDLDPSFGDGGRKGSDNSFYGFGRPALDAAGRLVVAYGPGLQRLTVAGAFDASWTTTVVPTLVSVAVQSDGNVVALGQAEGPTAPSSRSLGSRAMARSTRRSESEASSPPSSPVSAFTDNRLPCSRTGS